MVGRKASPDPERQHARISRLDPKIFFDQQAIRVAAPRPRPVLTQVRNTCFGVLGAVCSASSAPLPYSRHVRQDQPDALAMLAFGHLPTPSPANAPDSRPTVTPNGAVKPKEPF